MSTTDLILVGDVTPASVDGAMWFVGCVAGACITDDTRGTFGFTR